MFSPPLTLFLNFEILTFFKGNQQSLILAFSPPLTILQNSKKKFFF